MDVAKLNWALPTSSTDIVSIFISLAIIDDGQYCCVYSLFQIDALPEVVEAVRGSGIEVYLDGGVRKGTDVLKALALGAKAVFIGRPVIWGLACDVSITK